MWVRKKPLILWVDRGQQQAGKVTYKQDAVAPDG